MNQFVCIFTTQQSDSTFSDLHHESSCEDMKLSSPLQSIKSSQSKVSETVSISNIRGKITPSEIIQPLAEPLHPGIKYFFAHVLFGINSWAGPQCYQKVIITLSRTILQSSHSFIDCRSGIFHFQSDCSYIEESIVLYIDQLGRVCNMKSCKGYLACRSSAALLLERGWTVS